MTEKPFDFMEGLTKKELIELDSCTRCNECLAWCPIQDVTDDRDASPPARIHAYKDFVERTHTLKGKLFSSGKVTAEELKKFLKILYGNAPFAVPVARSVQLESTPRSCGGAFAVS